MKVSDMGTFEIWYDKLNNELILDPDFWAWMWFLGDEQFEYVGEL